MSAGCPVTLQPCEDAVCRGGCVLPSFHAEHPSEAMTRVIRPHDNMRHRKGEPIRFVPCPASGRVYEGTAANSDRCPRCGNWVLVGPLRKGAGT